MGYDLVVGHRRSDLPEVLHHEHRHMVAAGDRSLKKCRNQGGAVLDLGLLS
jgi:hypothetical protein